MWGIRSVRMMVRTVGYSSGVKKCFKRQSAGSSLKKHSQPRKLAVVKKARA